MSPGSQEDFDAFWTAKGGSPEKQKRGVQPLVSTAFTLAPDASKNSMTSVLSRLTNAIDRWRAVSPGMLREWTMSGPVTSRISVTSSRF